MILTTFTRGEVIEKLHQAADLFEERSRNYCYQNQKEMVVRLKKKKEEVKLFSCELDGQRYYQKYTFIISNGFIKSNCSSVVTVLNDSKGVFVLLHSPLFRLASDYYMKTSLELRIFSGHFVNRFFERTGRSATNMTLVDKTLVILEQMQSLIPSTVEDEVIRRHGEPSLPFTFLQEGKKEVECSYLNDGDIAIVERYGPVPVWRTYVTKEMLFDSQLKFVDKPEIQEGIQFAKNVSSKMNKK